MITEIKFRPELSRWYKPRAWLSRKLWKLACWAHPWPPKFREEIADEFFTEKRKARIFVEELEINMRKMAGLYDQDADKK